jgi:hypothetical protein
VAPRPPTWTWLLVVSGLVLMLGLAAQAVTAYATIDAVNQAGQVQTPNVVLLFQDLAVNGPRVGANVDANSRAAYGRALIQYVLDGTGVCLGLALAFTGLFIRVNR